MSRYIDADKLLNSLPDDLPYKASVKRVLTQAPTADAVEVRHGEWKKSSPYNRFMNCSVCGFGQDHTTFKYCPNCGAKMDGERREK
jgi:rubrerythrin